VTREWDDTAEMWTACPERIELEPYVLLRICADERRALAVQRTGPGSEGVRLFHSKVCEAFPNSKIVYFVEGIKEFVRNRTYGQ
jgi:hypothetical protein